MRRRLTVDFLLALAIALSGWSSASQAQSIDGGDFHTCALDASGKAFCWGANGGGQLGLGTTGGVRTSAALVPDLASGTTSMGAGGFHACAIDAAGGAYCWGANGSGQLGDGSFTDSNRPRAVTGLASGVAALAVGGEHTCALTTGGGVKCWGANLFGQLGDGTTTNRSAPVDVPGLTSGVVAIAAGSNHTCAVTAGGSAKCWGYNSYGAVGDGTSTSSDSPVQVSGLTSGVAAISAGAGHTCALMADGTARCWGWNANGQVGDNTSTYRYSPVDVVNLPGTLVSIATGNRHNCALVQGGGVHCWGAGDYGQQGDSTNQDHWTPTIVPGLESGIVAVGAGGDHACAILGGGAKCWGRNDNGQLGDGTLLQRNFPVGVVGFAAGGTAPPASGAAQSIAAGSVHACALGPAGDVRCWGDNSQGQLGDGTLWSRTVPTAAAWLDQGVTALAAGYSHTCALLSGGVKCWGENSQGAVGDGTNLRREAPTDVQGLASGVAAISAGGYHTCALTQAGGVLCWGAGGAGQLGDGTWNDRFVPTAVPGLQGGVVAIAAANGGFHTCALLATGAVRCWGENGNGQLGDGTLAPSPSPVDVPGLPAQVDAITAGGGHNCVHTTPGALYCWGRNDWGQLGDGTSTNRTAPVAVAGLSGSVAQAAAGGYHTCALMADATVQCWGINELGELGVGPPPYQRSSPADVPGLSGPAAAVTAGFRFNCVRLADGTVQCWGANGGGQLGRGSTSLYENVPAGVVSLQGGDDLPDTFSFAPAVNVAPGSTVTSAPVTITGITVPAIVQVSNGSWSLGCSGSFTEDWGAVLAGQSICVRHTAAPTPSTNKVTVLYVGSVFALFTSTTAGFTLQEYTLTVSKAGSGAGTVTSNPVGINCGATCSFPFGDATVVSLTAAADAGSTFAGWSGDCTGTGACSVTMSQARSVAATFVVADTTPDAFSFGTSSGVTPGATVTSKPETITGINAPAPVTVVNGLYAINCQEPYVSTPGTITNGQTVCVQHVAAPTALTSRTTTLTIGDERGAFTSTTGGTAQAITFGQQLDRAVGSPPFNLFAFASSGLPVTFSSQTPGVCTVSGNTVTIVAAGTCTIAANQGGSATYGPAPQVVRSLAVSGDMQLDDVVDIASGYFHNCALTARGGVKCWGDNQVGQLGDPSRSNWVTPADVSGLASGVVAIAAGSWHSCAVTAVGGVKCWGSNSYGQLGDGTKTDRSAPVDVPGLSSGVRAIAAGERHTCALTDGGGVKCWGSNSHGQLGDGTYGDALVRLAPVDVSGLASGVAAIAAGHVHTCAITSGGGAKCWGDNSFAQIGNGGVAVISVTPADVSGLGSGVMAIAGGEYHTCAAAAGGAAKCWGNNFYGQIGDGTMGNYRYTPEGVSGLASGATAVAVNVYHSCALTDGGGVKCWGANAAGALGDGTTTDRLTPVEVLGLASPVTAISTGYWHSCALTTIGGVKCWGSNDRGQLGDDSVLIVSLVPVDVAGLSGGDTVPNAFAFTPQSGVATGSVVTSNAVTIGGLGAPSLISVANGSYSIGCGATFTTDPGVITNGQTVCVRHTAASNLFTSTTTTLTIGGATGSFTSTTAGFTLQEYTLTVAKAGSGSGTVTSNPVGINCGATCSFPFGDATVVSLTPTADAGSVFAGWSGACTGTGACSLTMSQARSVTANYVLADTTPVPFAFDPKTGVTPGATVTSKAEMITGINAPAPVTVAGGLYAIGCVEPYVSTPGTIPNGQLVCVQHVAAPTALTSRTTTLTVGGVSGSFTSTTGGTAQNISFGQQRDRAVSSPPFNLFAFASSGLPVTFSSQTPGVCTVSGNTVTIVAAGTCTIAADQEGNATYGPAPQVVRSLTAVAGGIFWNGIAIASGQAHNCAITAIGGLKCWGWNNEGQLGDGTTEARYVPTDVTGLANGVVDVSGNLHTCALTASGGVKCWGDNGVGQLGDGTTVDRRSPVDVAGLASGIAGVSVGQFHSCALTVGGGVKCWGWNSGGALGVENGYFAVPPVDVTGLGSGVASIAAGYTHSCALMESGGVRCWGSNLFGELGDGSTIANGRFTPMEVTGLASGVVAVSASNHHSCAVLQTGRVKCWGFNSSGQLGNGAIGNSPTPVDVVGLSDIVAIAAGNGHTCALGAAGTVKCWGRNESGQLGSGPSEVSATPVDVPALSGVVAISAGNANTCALNANGTVRCWGFNNQGELGDGSTLSRAAPSYVHEFGGIDLVPAASGFLAQQGVALSTLVTSSGMGVYGINAPTRIVVTGGEYSLGCNSQFTTVPGYVSPQQAVCVRHTSSATPSASVTTTLTIGGVPFEFTSTTAPQSLLVSPSRLDFASRLEGTSSGYQTVTVSNVGSQEIVGLGWGTVSNFLVTPVTCGSTLTANATCTLRVAFVPQGVGARAEELTIYAANSLPRSMSVLLTGTGLASDTSPNAFAFTDQYLVAPSTVITSAPLQVTGLTGAATVSVANGSYCVSPTSSCATCTFRQDPSTITDGQYLCARHTSSPIPGGQVDTLVFVGGMGDAFTSITIDTVPAPFTFPPATGVAPASTQTSAAAAIVGINAPAPVTVSGGTYSIGCTGAYTASPGSITNGQTVCVRHTAGSSAGATVSTTLDVGGVTATFASKVIEANPALSVSPAELGFGGQSMNTTAPARIVTITNTGTGPLTVDSVAASTWFTVVHSCASVAAGASCPLSVRFTPAAEGALSGTLTIATSAGSQSVALTGTGERSFTTHYYQAILRRAPDAGGKAFWDAEAVRMRDLGASINEAWFAMASYFFTSPEYLAFGRDDTGFATDLYTTFFNRAPDAGGLAFWTGQLAAGMPREVMLASFMFSPEFVGFTEALFGVNAVRKEVDMVVDFYRGLLARLPDTDGFGYWVGQFRQAQCQGAGAVTGRAETISSAFALSPEYASRARTAEQYVGDLYNAFLRRGGDLGGVQYWIGEITGGNRTREQVRQAFVASPEFQGRVAGVIAQGCAP
ncbi:MAG TPA: DUF4214 domain-containing protein [Gemmatimonadales bacterium]|nr:DUF4214 domain-containing protein [Gemmatimonadales bacterium]